MTERQPTESATSEQDKKAARREYFRQWRARQTAKGLCTKCTQPAAAGNRLCEDHILKGMGQARAWRSSVDREVTRKKQREYCRDKVANGRCANCASDALPDETRCQRCKDRARTIKRRRKIQGKCSHCAANARPGKQSCLACYTKRSARIQKEEDRRYVRGFCIHCGKAAFVPGKKGCAPCAKKLANRAVKRRMRNVAAGLCAYCAKGRPQEESLTCEWCYIKRIARSILGSAAHAQALKELLDSQGGICPYSGQKISPGVNAELDHIIPESRGGQTDLGNLQWVLARVNQMKYSYPEDEFLAIIKSIYEHRGLA